MIGYVKSIRVRGLFGRFDLEAEFDAGVNVIYGHNGSGKTTLLNILANVLNGDYDRFAFLEFRSIVIEFDDGCMVKLYRTKDEDDIAGTVDYLIRVDDGESTKFLPVHEIESHEPTLSLLGKSGPECIVSESSSVRVPLPAVYFPAFRVVVEAWKSVYRDDYRCMSEQATHFARCWLFPFVPRIDYPSLFEIEQELAKDDSQLARNGWISSYLECVNSFLEGKRLVVNSPRQGSRLPPVELRFDDGMHATLGALSSGERQILILMYATTKVDSHKVLLIDEPEISLHVTWQRLLLKKMAELFRSRQIIACTHSPVILADYPNRRLVPVSTSDEYEEIPYDG